MSFSFKNPLGLGTASEVPSAAESVDGSSWVIAELMNQYRIASGKEPVQVVRLTRKLPDGEIDLIELSVRRKDPRLAQNLLKALLPLLAKLGPKSIDALELDEGERVWLSEFLGAYKDGSHPSCRIGK
jgi:hypothetical protein